MIRIKLANKLRRTDSQISRHIQRLLNYQPKAVEEIYKKYHTVKLEAHLKRVTVCQNDRSVSVILISMTEPKANPKVTSQVSNLNREPVSRPRTSPELLTKRSNCPSKSQRSASPIINLDIVKRKSRVLLQALKNLQGRQFAAVSLAKLLLQAPKTTKCTLTSLLRVVETFGQEGLLFKCLWDWATYNNPSLKKQLYIN